MAAKRTCPVCGEFFVLKGKGKRIYCSAECAEMPSGMRSIRRAKIGALTLEQVKERAEAEGLSYGEYMTRYYWS